MTNWKPVQRFKNLCGVLNFTGSSVKLSYTTTESPQEQLETEETGEEEIQT